MVCLHMFVKVPVERVYKNSRRKQEMSWYFPGQLLTYGLVPIRGCLYAPGACANLLIMLISCQGICACNLKVISVGGSYVYFYN